jgi:hypothetical protein
VRWVVIAVALGACKSDPPQATRVPQPAAAGSPRREPEVEAAIDAMRPALLLAEPTDTLSACVGPLEVVAIDQDAALLIAAGRPAPQGKQFTTPPEINAVVRYASKGALSSSDVSAIQAWARPRPAGFVWGFLDSKARVLQVVDVKTRSVLCHTPLGEGPESSAVADKLAVLRAGTDIVVQPDPATDNSGPPLDPAQIPRGTMGVCFTYRDVGAEKNAFECETTLKACLANRRAVKSQPHRPVTRVSACTQLATKP